jgi:hypothetical protein
VCTIYILGGGSPNHYPLCALGLDACLHRDSHGYETYPRKIVALE